MTTLDITIFHTVASLIFGISAWTIALLAIISKCTHTSHRLTVSSFSLCALTVLLQLFEVNNRVRTNDFSAIADTIRAVVIASCVLIGITIILNAVALRKRDC